MSMVCFAVTDLHGNIRKYQKLLAAIGNEAPSAVFVGGDILPSSVHMAASRSGGHGSFVRGFLAQELDRLRRGLAERYPKIFLILGNDDGRYEEGAVEEAERAGLLTYLNGKKAALGKFMVYGYSYVPPTPFLLKDWERYDVSRYVDPGAVPLEEGIYSIPVAEAEIKYSTIKDDLENLAGSDDLSHGIFLFHAPPHNTKLDRLAADGKMIDGVPLELHVGSIAVRRFIEARQPLLSMHGHIHESPRLMNAWRDRIGKTHIYSAAHDGPELALIRFDPAEPGKATRELI